MSKNTKGIEVAEIMPDRCIGCQICIGECPVGAIELSPEGVAVINPEVCIGCGKCNEVCPVGAVKFERKKRPRKAVPPKGPPSAESEYQGVAVFIEIMNEQGASVSWELIGKARQLAETLKTKVMGFLPGSAVDEIAKEAIAYGCDEVHIIDDPLLATYLCRTYGSAVTGLCEKLKPSILLIGATPLGRDLSPVVSTKLSTGLTADCTGLAIDDETSVLLMTRPTFGGNIMATIFCEHGRPQMSTVRPKVFKATSRDMARQGKVERHEWSAPHDHLPEVVDFIPEAGELDSLDIANAPALVVAGKGACDPAALPLLEDLAQAVHGVIACSRPVVESGLMPYERQVGQTGKTVAPKLYIAVGVSGAVQHLVGMQGSEKIVAINSDPHAPIFSVADIGIVGDYLEVLPLLTEEFRKRSERS